MNNIENIEAVRTRVRAHDPVSSILAAERSLRFSKTHKGLILAALETLGPSMAREISSFTGLGVEQIDRRLPDLLKDGLAEVVQVGDVDLMRDGCRVWRLTEKNLPQSTTKS